MSENNLTREQFDLAVAHERFRQIDLGYDAAHDDACGIVHLFDVARHKAWQGRTIEYAAILDAIYEKLTRDADDEIERLRAELSDRSRLISKQSDLLTAAVNALRGDPPELVWWSHHDVEQLATEQVAENARLRNALEKVRIELDSPAGWPLTGGRIHEIVDEALTPRPEEQQ